MKILNEIQTINKIYKGVSIGRYGDGELINIIENSYKIEKMQDFSLELKNKLVSIIHNPKKDFLICLPYFNKDNMLRLKNKSLFNRTSRLIETQYLNNILYKEVGSPMITRPDNTIDLLCEEYFNRFKNIFKDKKVLIINFNEILLDHPIFSMSKENSFLKIPKRNCFNSYREILNTCKDYIQKNYDLIAVSAGPTSTCLSYDLCNQIQTIDIGQICRIYNQFYNLEFKNLVSQL